MPRPIAQARICAALVAALLATLVLGVAPATHADQRRDFMLDFQPAGTFGLLDYLGTGVRFSLEHRAPIYGKANDVTVGSEALVGYPLGELTTRLDLRVLFLNLGGTLAYRVVWRNLGFEPGVGDYCTECGRTARGERDRLFGESPGTADWPWIEGRAALLFPFNDYLVMATLGALRHEGSEARSYDWFFANVHDGGLVGRWESQLYLKHRDWGGIGPYLQLMSLPRAGQHESEWAGGFNATTRLGLVPRGDLLFLTFLVRPGDPRYGQHTYHAPIRALLIYRMILEL